MSYAYNKRKKTLNRLKDKKKFEGKLLDEATKYFALKLEIMKQGIDKEGA